MRRPKSPAIIIMLLSMLIVAAGVVVYVGTHARSAWKSLPRVLSSVVSEHVDGKFTVGKVDVSATGIVFHNVKLTSDKDGRKQILDAEAVKVGVKLVDLIRGRKDPARSINSVEIIRPNAFLERGADGRWNVAELFKPSADRPQTQFKGRVVIRSGTVTFADRGQAGKTHKNGLKNLNAVIDFADAPVADCRLTAEGTGGRVGKISVKARYNLGSRSLNADLDGLRADASYWTKYPFNLKFMSVPSGMADLRMHISRAGEGKPLRYNGEVLVSDAVVQFKWMRKPARGVDGLVEIKPNEVKLALRARMESTPLEVSGRVIGFRGSRLALDLRSDRANLREISRLVAVTVPKGMVLPTSGRAHVSISGPAKKLSAVFKADAPSLAYNKFSGKDIHLEGTYSAKRVVIRSAVGRAYGGSLEVSGEFGWGPRKGISLHGSASGVRLSTLPQLKVQGIDAVTSGHFGLEWGATSGTGTYRGSLTDGIFRNYKFGKGALAVSYDGDTVHLDEVSADLLGGRIAISGGLPPNGSLDLDVSGAGINLTAVQELFWSYPTVGKLQFAGKLRGSTKSPSFDGQVEAYRVMVNGISAEHITADLEASRKQIRLRELEIDDPVGRVVAAGEIANPFSTIPRLDLSLRVESLNIEPWAISAGVPFPLSGSLSSDMKVTNTLFNPDIQGGLRIEEGQVADMPLDSAVMQIAYHNAQLALSGIEARSGNGVLKADGSIGFDDNDVRAAFDIRDLPIKGLAGGLQRYAELAGNLNARGEMSGTLEDTVLRADLDSGDLKINGRAFDKFQADLSWADGKLQVGKASLADDDAEYLVSNLSYSPLDEKLELTAESKGALIERLIAMIETGRQNGPAASLRGYLASVPRPCRGTLDAKMTGGISLADSKVTPDLHFAGVVSNARVGLSDINTVSLEGDWQAGTVTLSKIEALDGDTDVVASATLGSEGQIDVRVDAHGVDLGSAARWLKFDQNFSGSADVTIIAGGTTKAPSVEASLDIENPVIGGMKFDSLRARVSGEPVGEGRSAGNRLDIDDLTIVLGDSRLRASGFVPVDWSSYSIPRDKDLLVEMLLDDDSLKLLSAFGGKALVGEAGGTLAGKVSYGGTVEKPQLQGSLTWRDGSVQLARLGKPFEQIEADVTLSGHVLSIDKFTGRSAEGGSFRLTGPVDLAGLKPKLDLSLATSSLKVSGKNISGKYGESVEAVLDSDLRITGEWRTPLLAGAVAVPKGSIGMGGGDDSQAAAARVIDPRFDIRVTLGRGLVLKSARLEAALPGSLSVGGSLSAPIVDGLINLADGTIAFPMRSFKILPGSDMRLRMSPGQPVLAVLDVKARGRVVDVSPLGKRTKYDVTMEATGPLDKLRPTFTSSPIGLPEHRIMALVTGQYQFEQIMNGNQGQDIGKELSGLFSSAVMPSLFQPIEEAFEHAFGFDEFALEMGYQEPIQLSIGNQLGSKTYLSYSAALGARPDYADSQYQLKLSYRAQDNLEIGVHTDENRTIGVTAEGKIRF